jgi:hypothetical protein
MPEKPSVEKIPDLWWDIIIHCLQTDPNARPTLENIFELLSFHELTTNCKGNLTAPAAPRKYLFQVRTLRATGTIQASFAVDILIILSLNFFISCSK